MKLPLVLVLGIAAVSVSFNQRMFDPLTPLLAREFGVSTDSVVLLTTLFLLPYAFGQPILGALADALGKARVLRACVGIVVASTFASLFVDDFTTVLVLRFITGFGAGGCIPIGLALIADRTSADERQVAFSRFMVAAVVSSLFTAPISANLALALNWHAVSALAVLLGCGALALLAWQVRPNPSAVRTPLSFGHALATYRAILSIPRALICYAAVFAEGLFIFGYVPHLAVHFEAKGLGSIAQAGYALAASGIGGLVFVAIVPSLVRHVGPYRLMASGGLLLGLGLAIVALAPSWQVMAGGMALGGFSFYLLHSGLQAQVSEIKPEARSSVVSLHAFSLFVGFSAGPVLFGWLSARIGFSAAVGLCAVGIAAAGLVASRLLARRALNP